MFASSPDATESAGVSLAWVVPRTGALRSVRVITAFELGRNRVQFDTLTGTIRC
jgi:hypothetical protein